jgi:hypothetical protein
VELRDRRIENVREQDVMNCLIFKIQKVTKSRRNFSMKNCKPKLSSEDLNRGDHNADLGVDKR